MFLKTEKLKLSSHLKTIICAELKYHEVSLHHVDVAGVRLQYLKCNNELNGFPEPGVKKGIDDGIETGVKEEQTYYKSSR